jgi:hypothetical protein
MTSCVVYTRGGGVAPTSILWYHRSLSDDSPAREGLAVRALFYTHFAVSMCVAAACSPETPYAERTARPPPQPAIDARC